MALVDVISGVSSVNILPPPQSQPAQGETRALLYYEPVLMIQILRSLRAPPGGS